MAQRRHSGPRQKVYCAFCGKELGEIAPDAIFVGASPDEDILVACGTCYDENGLWEEDE